MATIYRQNPEQNVNRFYSVEVALDLFGEACVMRSWGRIGARNGSSMTLRYADVSEARQSAARLIKSKRRKGYRTRPSPMV